MKYTTIKTVEQFFSLYRDPNQPMLFECLNFLHTCMSKASFVQDTLNKTGMEFCFYDEKELKAIKLDFREIRLENSFSYRLYSWSCLIREPVSGSFKLHSHEDTTSRVEYHIMSGEPEYYYFNHYGEMGRSDGLYLIDNSTDISYHFYRKKNIDLCLKEIRYENNTITKVILHYNNKLIELDRVSAIISRIKDFDVSELAYIEKILSFEEKALIDMLLIDSL